MEELSFEIATPSEVREMLQLKGAENVRFTSSAQPVRETRSSGN